MITRNNTTAPKTYVDWISLLVYFALVLIGWLNIYATGYDDNTELFDFAARHGKQLMWMGVAFVAGLVIMLLDDKYYHMLAYFIYALAIVTLLAVLIGGTTVKGAKAWISIGSIRIQPAEFVKLATALALARYMSRYSFSLRLLRDRLMVGAIVMLPIMIIILQNDTGSAMVYGAFLITLYREGLNKWVYVALAMLVTLAVLSLLLEPATILLMSLAVCIIGAALSDRRFKDKAVFAAAIALGATVLYFGGNALLEAQVSFYLALLISSCVSIVFAFIYGFRKRIASTYNYIALFILTLPVYAVTNYVTYDLLPPHQRDRILAVLGIENNLSGIGYNVNQSKIATGSGGFFGKGFLEGTQTKFNFVPEQSTDFIFSTLGEEWGFLGCSVVVALFAFLIIRLIDMGERQRETFGRVYCYSIASIFFIHVMINIGMTIGLFPVVGIPLPFFSYGGSSFLAFSLMFFVALRLDSGKRELMRQ